MNHNDILQRLHIEALNKMQEDCIEACRTHKRIVLLSPTGSGKTLAYLLPLVGIIDTQSERVQAIVIVPSRELARQTCQVLQQMQCGVRAMAVYGGRPAMEEHRQMNSTKPQLIIGTPGRLNDHLAKLNFTSEEVATLVIDEFDKCLELGFQEEMQQVVRQLPAAERRILLSATDSPDIPTFVGITDAVKRLDFLACTPPTSERISRSVVHSPEKDKLDTLADTLCALGEGQSIVFVGFRESVERVANYLRKQHFCVSAFHGGMEQDLRERALFRFTGGACNVLVATDLAARGLDIPEVDNIIHYHLPIDQQTFVHRNGRTARWDANGRSIVILGPQEHLPEFMPAPNHVMDDSVTYEATKRRLNGGLSDAPQPVWESFYIGRGKKDKLSRGDIAGFMMKTGGLAKDEVGRIEVRDHCAYVSVARLAVRELQQRIRGCKIKGMKTIIEPTRG
ncbi:MAG: DEAD/DEAH box helicase [Bacteroidales bacterium]|nr:DEAD/DEAH box helicase [Candidatus Physcousia equi]